MVEFSSLFKKIAKRIKPDDAKAVLKNAKTEIKSLDDILGSIKVTKDADGFLKFNGHDLGTFMKRFYSGDLQALKKLLGSTTNVTHADKSAFRELIGETPYKNLTDLDELVEANKIKNPKLDVDVGDIGKLDAATKKQVETATSNLLTYFKTGSVITLTIGAVVVGADWLIKANESRKGCHMLTVIDNKTTWCRLNSFTCQPINTTPHSAPCTNFNNTYYNIVLMFMEILTIPSEILDLSLKIKVPVQDISNKPVEMLKGHYDEIESFIVEKMKTLKFKVLEKPCEIMNEKIEKNKPLCRMCDITANPLSTTYLNPTLLPKNITFVCNNPTILNTISDVIYSTGKNILTGVGSVLSKSTKLILIAISVILVCVIIGSIALKFLMNSKNSNNDQKSSIDVNLINEQENDGVDNEGGSLFQQKFT